MGQLTATIYNHGNLSTAVATTTNVVDAGQNMVANGVGDGYCVYPIADATFYAASVPGRVMKVTMADSAAAGGSVIVALFIIDTGQAVHKNGVTLVRVSGPDLTSDLSRRKIQSATIDDGSEGLATDDITQIMAYASAWSTSFISGGSGTENGTYHVVAGESVLDLLNAAAEQSGEWFTTDLGNPRTLYWQRAYDDSPTLLVFVGGISEISGNNHPVIRLTLKGTGRGGVSRVYVYGAGQGDDRFTFAEAFNPSQDARVNLRGMTATAAQSLLVNTTVESNGYPVTEEVLQFPSIEPADASDATAVKTAAVALVNAGAAYLESLSDYTTTISRGEYELETILHQEIRPLQLVEVNYSDNQLTLADDFVVTRAKHAIRNGVRITTLTLALAGGKRSFGGESIIAKAIHVQQGVTRHGTTAGGAAPVTPVDHGSLTGLGDDDHSQYLLADGSRQLTGNMAVAAGVTVDGVDISAHAADANAHHDAATAGDGISLSGQQISVKDGDGLTIDGSGNLVLGTPGALSVSSTNSVTGTSHTHSITASHNPGAAERLLKTDTSGILYLNRLDALAELRVYQSGGSAYLQIITNVSASYLLQADGNIYMATAEDANKAIGFEFDDGNDGRIFTGLDLTGLQLEAATGDLTLTPGGISHVVIDGDLRSENYVADTTGWSLTEAGVLEVRSFTADAGIISGALDVGQDLTVGLNVLFVDESGSRVGINCAPDAQFALDINGNVRWQGYGVGKMALQIPDAVMICHFDGPPPPETDFTGTALGHMGQTPDHADTVLYRPGKFGKAVQAAMAKTNQLKNPAFESATPETGWTWSGSGSFPAYGLYWNRCFRSEAATESVQQYVIVSAGSTYVASAYVRGTGAYEFGDLTGTNENPTITGTPASATEWERIQFTWTQSFPGNALIGCRQSGTPAGWVEFDAIQLELGSPITPFMAGSLPNHSWQGTDYDSKSDRSAMYLTYDVDVPDAGTVMLWLLRAGEPTVQEQIVRGDNNDTWFISVHSTSGGTLRCRVNDGVTNFGSSLSFADGWHHLVMTWGSGTMRVYYDGAQVGSDYSYTTFTPPTILRLNADVDGWIDDLVLVERVMNAAEIRAVYESNAPVFAETSTWSFQLPNNLVWADEEGFWMRDANGNAMFGLVGVDGKSWGGLAHDAGDMLIGNSGSDYIRWDASAGTLEFVGDGGGVTNIDGGSIQTGTVDTVQLNATAIDGMTITGSTIRTAASGARVEMNTTRLFGTDGSDTQWEVLTSSGQLTAGGGQVTLDIHGITITPGDSNANSISWNNGGADYLTISANTTGSEEYGIVDAQDRLDLIGGSGQLRITNAGADLLSGNFKKDGTRVLTYVPLFDTILSNQSFTGAGTTSYDLTSYGVPSDAVAVNVRLAVTSSTQGAVVWCEDGVSDTHAAPAARVPYSNGYGDTTGITADISGSPPTLYVQRTNTCNVWLYLHGYFV